MTTDLFRLESLSIELDNPTCTYFAGDEVKGYVTLDISEVEPEEGEDGTVKRILNPIGFMAVKIRGKAYTYWHTAIEETRRKFGGKEKYIDTMLPLNRKGQQKCEIRLQPGVRKYTFRYRLPWDLPSSYEAKKGGVEYYVKVYVRNVEKDDVKEKKHFTVIGISDLNIDGDVLQPIELKKEKDLCCLCCKSNQPVGFRLVLPRTRFVPDEWITFDLELTNGSKRAIRESGVNLLEVTTFKGIEMRPRKIASVFKTTEKVLEHMDAPVLSGGNIETFTECRLKVPRVAPSKLPGCSLIEVDYYLQVKMKIPYALPLEGKVGIYIGTIPLREREQSEKQEQEEDSTGEDTEETTEQFDNDTMTTTQH